MRVLHVSSGNLYGGVETLLVTLARFRQLCPEMEQHFAFSFEGKVSEEVKATGTPVYHLGEVRLSRPWTIWRARKKLRGLMRHNRFDVMVCHSAWPLAVFGPVAKGRCKLAFWMHDWSSGREWVDRIARTVVPDLAICNSRFTASGLPNLFPKIASRIINYPVRLDRELASITSRSITREKTDAGSDAVVIIQVSRMEDWKGHLLHLQALAPLNDVPSWTCWFVGGAQRREEQEYVRKLQETAASLGIAERVRFLGQRSDVPDLLAAADVFCQPNKGPEPFGIVFIEALLAGLPIVATAMGGALEIIDSSCGLLVPPGDVTAIANALRTLIESKETRENLGRCGPSRAKQLCDPGTQLRTLKQALSEA